MCPIMHKWEDSALPIKPLDPLMRMRKSFDYWPSFLPEPQVGQVPVFAHIALQHLPILPKHQSPDKPMRE